MNTNRYIFQYSTQSFILVFVFLLCFLTSAQLQFNIFPRLRVIGRTRMLIFCCVSFHNSNKNKNCALSYWNQFLEQEKQNVVFSSPELKAQVSFSDHLSSVVCLSVCLSVRLSVNFSHFHLLLQNHWANFNQTWHKASLGEGDASLFK